MLQKFGVLFAVVMALFGLAALIGSADWKVLLMFALLVLAGVMVGCFGGRSRSQL